jgi:hypothetical protein
METNFIIFRKSFLIRVLNDNWKDISISLFTIILDCFLLIDPPLTNIKLSIIILTISIVLINLIYQLFQTARREKEYHAIVRDLTKGVENFLFSIQVIMYHGDKPDGFSPLSLKTESDFLSNDAKHALFTANLSPYRRPIIGFYFAEGEFPLPIQIKKSFELNIQYLTDIILLHSNNISSRVKNHLLEIKHNQIVSNATLALEMNTKSILDYSERYSQEKIDKKNHKLIVFTQENQNDYEQLIKILFALKRLSEK